MPVGEVRSARNRACVNTEMAQGGLPSSAGGDDMADDMADDTADDTANEAPDGDDG